MTDPAPKSRTPKIKTPAPRKKSASEVFGETLLLLGAVVLLLAGATLLLPFSLGFLLAWWLPRRGLPALIGPLLCLCIAALLSTKFGLDSVDAQKAAFLALFTDQYGWFLENWPRYVTDGPLGMKFGPVPPLWAYFFLLGVPVGAMARLSGIVRLFTAKAVHGFLPSHAPQPASAAPTSAATTPVGGGSRTDETTDNGAEATSAYTVTALFTKQEMHRYTVAIRQARSVGWQRIRYWLHGYGIFRRVPPHLLPCNRVKGGIDRVFGDFHTRLWLSLPCKLRDTTTSTVYQPPIQGTDTGERASYRVGVPANAPLHGNAWHTGQQVSHHYRVPTTPTTTVYTWGDTGMVGSVELVVSPAKVGKTKLLTGLANAQRTGAPFLGRPTVQTGVVQLVEESASLYEPKRREAAGLPPAPIPVNDHVWRHRVSRSDSPTRRSMPITAGNTRIQASRVSTVLTPKSTSVGRVAIPDAIARYQVRKVAVIRKWANYVSQVLTCPKSLPGLALDNWGGCAGHPQGALATVQLTGDTVPHPVPWLSHLVAVYRITRKWLGTHAAGHLNPRKTSEARNDGLPSGNEQRTDLLAVLYGPSVERGLVPLAYHLAVAMTVARVRSVLTGIPWVVIQVDSLFHWCPEAEQDAAAAMSVMQLFKVVASCGFLVRVVVHAKAGRVSGPENITRQCDFLLHLSPLPKTANARDTSKRRLSAEGRFEDRPKPDDLDYALVAGTLSEIPTSAKARYELPAKLDLQATAAGSGATISPEDGSADAGAGKRQNGRPGGSQGKPNLALLLSMCPPPDGEPILAADVVRQYRAVKAVQRDRVYNMARELEQAGKLTISFVPGTKRLQWQQSRPK